MEECIQTKLQGALDINNQTLFDLIAVDLGFTSAESELVWNYLIIPTRKSLFKFATLSVVVSIVSISFSKFSFCELFFSLEGFSFLRALFGFFSFKEGSCFLFKTVSIPVTILSSLDVF